MQYQNGQGECRGPGSWGQRGGPARGVGTMLVWGGDRWGGAEQPTEKRRAPEIVGCQRPQTSEAARCSPRMRSAGPTRDAGNSPPQEMHASALTHNFVSFRRGVCHIPLDKNPCCRQLSQDPAGTPQDGAHRRKPTSVPHTCAGGRR